MKWLILPKNETDNGLSYATSADSAVFGVKQHVRTPKSNFKVFLVDWNEVMPEIKMIRILRKMIRIFFSTGKHDTVKIF